MGLGSQFVDKKSSASIACFLASKGADINVKNRKGQTPLDLCPDPNLCKTLAKCSKERRSSNLDSSDDPLVLATSSIASKSQPMKNSDYNGDLEDECLICCDSKRDLLFMPCRHLVCCSECGSRMKKCLVCRELIVSKIKVC